MGSKYGKDDGPKKDSISNYVTYYNRHNLFYVVKFFAPIAVILEILA